MVHLIKNTIIFKSGEVGLEKEEGRERGEIEGCTGRVRHMERSALSLLSKKSTII